MLRNAKDNKICMLEAKLIRVKAERDELHEYASLAIEAGRGHRTRPWWYDELWAVCHTIDRRREKHSRTQLLRNRARKELCRVREIISEISMDADEVDHANGN